MLPKAQRQASYARELIEQPVRIVLQMPHPDLLKMLEFKPGKTWSSWGTLLNRKVEARVSEIGGREGRGLFAGVRFKRGEVITLYGGELLTAQKAKEITDHSYMLRISDSLYCIDGSQFANRITEREGDRYLPLPADVDAGVQGAGSLANDARSDANANAKLEFKVLGGRKEGAKLLPRVPMLVAMRDITAGEEILFNCKFLLLLLNSLLPLRSTVLVPSSDLQTGRTSPTYSRMPRLRSTPRNASG
jgi:hypothetical protein